MGKFLRRVAFTGVPGTAVFLGLLEAYLRWEINSAAKAAPSLGPLPTIDESELSQEEFYREYVLKKRAVIIRLAQPDKWNKTRALEKCADHKAIHISDASYAVIKHARHWWWIRIPFEWIFLPMIGMWTTLDEQLRIRIDVPLDGYIEYAEQCDASCQSFSLGLPLFITRLLPHKLFLMLDFFARPRYLHDLPLNKICKHALDWIHVPKYVTPNWWFLGYEPEGLAREWERQYSSEPTFFIGKAHTMSYGLHQNIMDSDFFLMVLEGRKRYAVYDPDEADNLQVMPNMNVPLYVANPYKPDLIETPNLKNVKGWMGYLQGGEVLYSPGTTIHYFENYDFDKPTVALKFWYTSHEKVCDTGSSAQDCKKYFKKIGMPMEHNGTAAPTIRQYMKDGLKKRSKKAEFWQNILDQVPLKWETGVDPESGNTYYFNRATGVSTWEQPTAGNIEL
eukprot:gnl/MRDRNA2_/MRDRNA2_145159_c0_seq1.p1 gnl/MRDRNA2_/MRDRNA2_145159_c0~~gnl/MRDRNA2_/MRDRNA2_145159_c0_seq1.p1  ORF type:complete len:465 (-),score=66.20 gnl/MRDRNA2_/MRDRNA2_145159_c0_seq1:24-1370(-)